MFTKITKCLPQMQNFMGILLTYTEWDSELKIGMGFRTTKDIKQSITQCRCMIEF